MPHRSQRNASPSQPRRRTPSNSGRCCQGPEHAGQASENGTARKIPAPPDHEFSNDGASHRVWHWGRCPNRGRSSMGSRGDAYDNAVAETFFATLKKELVHRRSWPTRLALQSARFEYIEAFYNRQRRHSTLNMLSPANYEQLRLSPLGG